MTLSSSGRHRDQVPSPESRGAASSSDPGDSSGLHSGRQDQVPLLRVVKGGPSAEELAALTVVVAALSQRRSRRRPVPVGAWASYADGHRRPLQAGHGGWRAAGRLA
jgi:hypothetical protein